MKPLRVLSLSTLYPNDHTPNFGIFVERQMQAVAARGDVDLVMINPLGVPPFPLSRLARYRPLAALAQDEMRGGVRVLRERFLALPGPLGRFNAAAEARAVLPLVRRLHAQDPFDLIDAQFLWPDGPAAQRIASALNLPLSLKARGADVHFWGGVRGVSVQVRAAAHRADGLLAVSGGLADDIAAWGVPRGRITVHRTGLDRAVFRPLDRRKCRAQLGLPQGVPVLATVGALIPRKGQRFAIEALAHLPGAVLVIAGSGSDLVALKAAAQAQGVADRVRFMGAVPHGDLPQMLSAADVFVLPSASEGLANAWVEALACGTPVVTTPIPGALELLTDPAWGRTAPRDGAAIAAAVRDVLAAKIPRGTVVRGADPFSWEASAEALVAHWRQVAGV